MEDQKRCLALSQFGKVSCLLSGHTVSGGGSGLNGQSGAKQFFLAWNYHPIQPDVVPHDPRLFPNISQFWKGEKEKGEGS